MNIDIEQSNRIVDKARNRVQFNGIQWHRVAWNIILQTLVQHVVDCPILKEHSEAGSPLLSHSKRGDNRGEQITTANTYIHNMTKLVPQRLQRRFWFSQFTTLANKTQTNDIKCYILLSL